MIGSCLRGSLRLLRASPGSQTSFKCDHRPFQRQQQQRWLSSTPPPRADFQVYNSLTSKIEPVAFPDRSITWYSCGPTVYDDSHLGHARTYVAIDIVKRILTDYFKYDVHDVMGITDVDDKIIVRSKERGVTPKELAAHYEAEFWQDMDTLGVRRPTAVTRVSDHMREIVDYIEVIVKRGDGYVIDKDGVFFDVKAFGNDYGKLAPKNRDFFAVTENDKKKCAADFALWKFAKPGEPTWNSPWGEGRPGWHIECSAMTHSIFGTQLDVHVGGIDLAFPHHCNEIAQCESYNGRKHEWVKVFLHTGHLFIEGQKMSKSLKNFTSIREFLKEHDPNLFRMFIVQNLYRSSIHFSGDRVEEAKVNLSKFHHFFKAVEGRVRVTKSSQSGSEGASGRATYWEDPEREFHSAVLVKKKDIRVALATDFNTPLALSELIKIVSLAQAYMTKRGTHVRLDVLQSCSLYATSMLEMFGFHLNASDAQSTNYQAQGGHGAEMEAAVIDSMLSFRKDVRLACLKEKDPKEMKSKVLKLCDSVRNDVMPKLGVKVQDTADGNFIWVKEKEKPKED